MEIKENIILAPYTTYRIGGKARYFTTCTTENDLISAVNFAREKQINFFLLGSGSNVLFSDHGFSGLVIQNRLNNLKFEDNKIICGSGAILSLIIRKGLEKNLGGMENLFGIPGTIGGAVYQNAGAYGKEISEFIESCKIIDEKGVIKEVSSDYFQFGYRDSILKRKKEIVLEVTLKLSLITNASLQDNLNKIADMRTKSKPYGRSCGSFFKNPSKEISAGKLIDEVGLRGFSLGGAIVSNEHANYLINKDKAEAKDILKLAQIIKEKVFQEREVKLEEEVQIIDY